MSHVVAWSEFEARYLRLYAPPLRRPATFYAVRQVLREFGEIPELRTTADLTEDVVAAWVVRHLDRTPARTASLLRNLATAARYAVRKGMLDSSPFDFRKPDKWVRADMVVARPRKGPRHRSADEVGRVLALADAEAAEAARRLRAVDPRGGYRGIKAARATAWNAQRLRALVYVYAFLGLRKLEALTLEVADVDLGRRTLEIKPKLGWSPKTVKSSAVLPMAGPLVEVLRGWLPATGSTWLFPGRCNRSVPWTGGSGPYTAVAQIRLLGARAGVPDLTTHEFRKTVGTQAKRWGFSQLDLKKLLRHTNLRTQDWYDEPDEEVLRPAVDRIAYPHPHFHIGA